jgi:hypothetical protein
VGSVQSMQTTAANATLFLPSYDVRRAGEEVSKTTSISTFDTFKIFMF